MSARQPNRIVIVGGGTAGWMTAAALSRFLETGWSITLVESEAIGTVGVGEATIPAIRNFNAALGIGERDFLAATQGTFKLGIQFEGWGAFDDRYMHAFGLVGRAVGLIPFQHYWLKARAEGLAGPLGDYVLNAVVAGQNRFARIDRAADSPLPPMPYAYHFDASLYARYLRGYAEQREVVRREGRIVEVRRDPQSGDVRTLLLDDGGTLDGDLFVDCSGFRSLLLGETLGVGFIDWRQWLACDRAVAVPCAKTEPLVPYTRSIAERAGWRWRIPLQHRTGNGHVYCSDAMSDDEAIALLLAGLDGEPLAEPRPLQFTAGRRERFWERNVIAIGLASAFIEPLESTSIHLVQTAINRLLEFLPSGPITDAERDEYNRLSIYEIERIRDFVILHYIANGRSGERFWDRLREVELPETLARRIAMFRVSGQIVRDNDELFDVPGWVQVMIGQGIVPGAWHPLADQLSREQLSGFVDTVHRAYVQDAARIPGHGEFIARYCAAGDVDVAA